MKPIVGGAFTPGPWHLDPPGYCEYVWGPNQEMIATIRGVGAGLPREANAALIAAAPDLLSACQLVLAYLDHLEAGDQTEPSSAWDSLAKLRRETHRPLREALQCAIHKAETV